MHFSLCTWTLTPLLLRALILLYHAPPLCSHGQSGCRNFFFFFVLRKVWMELNFHSLLPREEREKDRRWKSSDLGRRQPAEPKSGGSRSSHQKGLRDGSGRREAGDPAGCGVPHGRDGLQPKAAVQSWKSGGRFTAIDYSVFLFVCVVLEQDPAWESQHANTIEGYFSPICL